MEKSLLPNRGFHPASHSLRVKGNNHLQVLDARAQSGRSRMKKRGLSPPSCSHQSEKEAIFGATKNAQRRGTHQPEAWMETLYFFFSFSAYILEAILLIEDPKLHYEGSIPSSPFFQDGWYCGIWLHSLDYSISSEQNGTDLIRKLLFWIGEGWGGGWR